MRHKTPDLTGKRFGALVPLNRAPSDKKGNPVWQCQCDCGQVKNIASRHLNSGSTRTCGCHILGKKKPIGWLGKTGSKHPSWKGGITIDGGYRKVYIGPRQYAREHRIIAECKDPNLIVHHKNGNRSDNHPDNLQQMTKTEHIMEHRPWLSIRSKKW